MKKPVLMLIDSLIKSLNGLFDFIMCGKNLREATCFFSKIIIGFCFCEAGESFSFKKFDYINIFCANYEICIFFQKKPRENFSRYQVHTSWIFVHCILFFFFSFSLQNFVAKRNLFTIMYTKTIYVHVYLLLMVMSNFLTLDGRYAKLLTNKELGEIIENMDLYEGLVARYTAYNFAELRCALFMTKTEVSKALGIQLSTYSAIESGKTRFSLTQLCVLFQLFKNLLCKKDKRWRRLKVEDVLPVDSSLGVLQEKVSEKEEIVKKLFDR